MKFVSGWTIIKNKIPKYDEFRWPFYESIDKTVLDKIIEIKKGDYDTVCKMTGETINVTWPVLIGKKNEEYIRNGDHVIKTHQTCGLGRFYSNSFITLPKKIKHTLFHYAGMVDLDQEKGHPRIAHSLGLRNGKDYETIGKYIKDPDTMFNQMAEHYGININDADGKNKDRLKWFFNLTVYGGGYDCWLEGLTNPSEKDLSLGYKPLVLKTTQPLQFMADFKEECKDISQKIYANNDEIREHLEKNHEDYGDKLEHEKRNCVVSYVMQIIENDALYKCYLYLKKNDLLAKNKHVSLEYDGLCFKPKRNISPCEIDALNKHIQKITGFNIKYVIKPYKDYNIYHDVIDIVKDVISAEQDKHDSRSYDVLKVPFNKVHGKIVNKSLFVKKLDNGEYQFFNRSNLKTSYEEMRYDEAQERYGLIYYVEKSFIDKWCEDIDKKLYDDVGIYPDKNKCPSNILNMWKDFAMESIESYTPKIKERDIILNHIKILCKNEEPVYNWFIRWIAQMIQYPDIKSVCPTLISEEGAGKGTLMKLFQKMLGSSKVLETTTPSKNVWGGSSNAIMKTAFLVNLNEMSQKESYGAEGQIKALITDPTIIIKELYTNPIVVDSYHRFIVSSNNDEAVAKKKGSRRSVIIRCSDELCVMKYKDDDVKHDELTKYHTKIHTMLEDVNVVKTVYDYFKNEIEDMCDFRKMPLPETEHDRMTQEMNVDVVESWLEEYVQHDLYEKLRIKYKEHKNCKRYTFPEDELIVRKSSADLFRDMQHWCETNNFKYDCNNVKFSVRLTRLNIDGISDAVKGKMGNYRLLNIKKIGKHFGLDLTYMSKDEFVDVDDEYY